MRNGKELGQQILVAMKDYVARASSALSSRLDDFEKRLNGIPAGRDGVDGKSVTVEEIAPLVKQVVDDAVALIPAPKDGSPGSSVTVDDVRPLIEESVAKAVAAIPPPKDGIAGKDGDSIAGPPGKDGLNAYEVAVSLGFEGSVHDWMGSLVGPKGDPGERGVPGESVKGDPGESVKGEPGADGKSITLDDVRPLIEQAAKAIPSPKDGAPGRDGKSVTVEELMPMFEAQVAKSMLDLERRGMDTIQRCIDRIEKPKDGVDGLGFDDMEIVHDGERTFTITLIRGDRKKQFPFKIPSLIERGVYRDGVTYERGDGVTAGGSYWIAQKDTTLRPGDNNSDWRLAVKKGRDGKDGIKGDRGESARALSGYQGVR